MPRAPQSTARMVIIMPLFVWTIIIIPRFAWCMELYIDVLCSVMTWGGVFCVVLQMEIFLASSNPASPSPSSLSLSFYSRSVKIHPMQQPEQSWCVIRCFLAREHSPLSRYAWIISTSRAIILVLLEKAQLLFCTRVRSSFLQPEYFGSWNFVVSLENTA